jgi:hypothetical protein
VVPYQNVLRRKKNVVVFPAITAEQLYHQDKRKRESDEKERHTQANLRHAARLGLLDRPRVGVDENYIVYMPKFVGWTPDSKKIVLYQDIQTDEYHIRRPDGELWAVGASSSIHISHNKGEDGRLHLYISCEAWTGEAWGTKYDVIAEDAIRI